jgi:hypothetical protein
VGANPAFALVRAGFNETTPNVQSRLRDESQVIQVQLVHAGVGVTIEVVVNLRVVLPASIEAQIGAHSTSITDQRA